MRLSNNCCPFLKKVVCAIHSETIWQNSSYCMTYFKTVVFSTMLLVSKSSQAQTLNSFKNDVERYAHRLKLPTLAVGVAHGDSLIFFTSVGSATLEAGTSITPDHIFSIASLTKSFTSVVMQQLEGEGKLSLTDPIDKFPNRYFTKERWTRNTTLAHILSQTSESRPEGSNFVYNGGKYNIVFNAFEAINPPKDGESMTRPFTKEVERRILTPLKMDHTLVRYDDARHDELHSYVVPNHHFHPTTQKFTAKAPNITQMECGPGYGMLSSLADLVKYSCALDEGVLISKVQYEKITSPFYPDSPYGMGWFTCNFEGYDLHWAYGYGSADASLLVKVPSRKLTFILLSSSDVPSGSTRLGYGNPLNSPLVCSFIRNYLLNDPDQLRITADSRMTEEFLEKVKKSHSRIFIEEAFAIASATLFSATTNAIQKRESIAALKTLVKCFPNDSIWDSPTAFELMAAQDDMDLLRFAGDVAMQLLSSRKMFHPASLYYAGVLQEKLQNSKDAMKFFMMLAEGEANNEQWYKFDALLKLGKYFQGSEPTRSKKYFAALIRLKEYINAADDQYKEAKELISKL